MDNREALIALNMIEHVGPVRLRHLLQHFGEPNAILSATEHELRRVHGVGEETAQAICGWESTVDLPAELSRAREYGCAILTSLDRDYPASLREIYDPPVALYVLGGLDPRDQQGIALVGSRQNTPYGMETARRLAYQLAYMGVTVVSGGARGIDTAAHQGALAAKGRTLAVLGTGINLVFPTENVQLFQRIAASGAVLTQFPFNRTADKQSFPIRNRIVAGMTLGTVVVEANLQSGALITANFATEYGRQVFAVPGRVDSPRSKGCHELIKKGAKLCESAEDVLSEFEYLFPPTNRPPAPNETGQLPLLELTDNERRVVEALTAVEQPMDAIIRSTGLPAGVVSACLLSLEMKQAARQLPGRLFVRRADT
ncbi:MAG: DNA-protecting protein DprA [Verrucomicrobia bacterium]|nr:DNA-protecting protein DprA [Verrucomicrobiota bacterium]